MKEYWIETEPIQFLAIYNMEIDVGVNRHGIAKICGYIADEREEEYLDMLMQEVWISITAVANQRRKNVFCGIVKNFKIGKKQGQKSLELVLVSGTFLMDLQKHTRLFQDNSTKYDEILRQLEDLNGSHGKIVDASLECPIENLIVQFEETDWEFLLRLLSNCQSFLVPEARKQGIFYSISFVEGQELVINNENYTLEKNTEEYMNKKNNGMFLDLSDSFVCNITERELYYLGDYVIWHGLKMYIEQITIQYINGELINHYKARTRKGILIPQYYQDKISGNSMMGIVREVKEDKVRIRIIEDENADNYIGKWFLFSTPYSSADGSGWYFMPETGDAIRLYFPSKIENEAYVISAVNMETMNDYRKNPDHKILKNKQNKEIRFTPDMILITNNNGMKIEMIDGQGIHIESDKSIFIESGEDMNIVSKNGSLVLAADSLLELNQGGTSIQLQDGIQFMGGEFHVQ